MGYVQVYEYRRISLRLISLIFFSPLASWVVSVLGLWAVKHLGPGPLGSIRGGLKLDPSLVGNLHKFYAAYRNTYCMQDKMYVEGKGTGFVSQFLHWKSYLVTRDRLFRYGSILPNARSLSYFVDSWKFLLCLVPIWSLRWPLPCSSCLFKFSLP